MVGADIQKEKEAKMKKPFLVFLILLWSPQVRLPVQSYGHFVGQSGCGIKPIKPIPPIGCKDLLAECVCDNRGENCHWEWKCVPN